MNTEIENNKTNKMKKLVTGIIAIASCLVCLIPYCCIHFKQNNNQANKSTLPMTKSTDPSALSTQTQMVDIEALKKKHQENKQIFEIASKQISSEICEKIPVLPKIKFNGIEIDILNTFGPGLVEHIIENFEPNTKFEEVGFENTPVYEFDGEPDLLGIIYFLQNDKTTENEKAIEMLRTFANADSKMEFAYFLLTAREYCERMKFDNAIVRLDEIVQVDSMKRIGEIMEKIKNTLLHK